MKREKISVTLTSVTINFINLIQIQARIAKKVLKIYRYVGEMFVEMEINAQNTNDHETKFLFQRSNIARSQSLKRTQIKIISLS